MKFLALVALVQKYGPVVEKIISDVLAAIKEKEQVFTEAPLPPEVKAAYDTLAAHYFGK